jgi:pimeloyl-ACP methyl ester carboxylesterase
MDQALLLPLATLTPVALLLLFHAGLRRSLAPTRTTEGGTPAAVGIPARDLWLPGKNGKRLFAWYAPAMATVPGDRVPAIALLHGWGGNAGHMLPLAARLHAAGHTVLLLDARNHGRSDEDRFSSMPRFAEDLGCALDWLNLQAETNPRRIAVIGHSVGAAAALLSASRRTDIAAVVSIAAFAHPESIMRRFLATKRIPFLPIGWYALRYVEWVIGHRFDAIAPENTIRRAHCPVLLVHGSEDETVPASDAEHLAARSDGRAQLLLMRGHHEGFEDIDEGVRAVLAFLAETAKPST